MYQHSIDAIGEKRAVHTSLLPFRAEHKVIDDQLALVTEDFGESLRAVWAFEDITFLDSLPRQFAALPGDLVAQVGQFLLLAEQAPSMYEPLCGVNAPASVIARDLMHIGHIGFSCTSVSPAPCGFVFCKPENVGVFAM